MLNPALETISLPFWPEISGRVVIFTVPLSGYHLTEPVLKVKLWAEDKFIVTEPIALAELFAKTSAESEREVNVSLIKLTLTRVFTAVSLDEL